MSEKHRRAQLIDGPIGKTLVNLSIPMFFGILSAIAFNLVDTFFVGQLGTLELAAMSFTFPVISIIGGVSMGLGIGASAVISRAIGEGDHKQVQRLASDSLMLSLIVVTIFVIVGLTTINPIFILLGATPDILVLIKQYMIIWYPGMIFLIIPMVGNNAIRATGDMKMPMIIMFVAFSINLILDPLLIFGLGPFPRMELAGAAWATVISRALTLVFSLLILYKRERMLTFKHPKMNEVLGSWKKLLFIGLPSAGTNLVRPIGTGIITKIVSTYGASAVAGYGVATRIDAFALIVIMALSSVLNPFLGQNLGAGKFDRINHALKLSQKFSLIWGAIMIVLFALSAKFIASLFSDNIEVIKTITLYLYIVPIGYGLFGVYALSNSAFNVLNKPQYAAVITIFQIFGLTIPLAYAGSYFFDLSGIFIALFVSNILAGIVAYFWLNKFVLSKMV